MEWSQKKQSNLGDTIWKMEPAINDMINHDPVKILRDKTSDGPTPPSIRPCNYTQIQRYKRLSTEEGEIQHIPWEPAPKTFKTCESQIFSQTNFGQLNSSPLMQKDTVPINQLHQFQKHNFVAQNNTPVARNIPLKGKIIPVKL